MKITLNLKVNWYSQPDEEGNQKLVRKGVKYKKTFNSENINVQQYITSKGTPHKSMCLVFDGEKEYMCSQPFEKVESLIKPIEVIGYKKWK